MNDPILISQGPDCIIISTPGENTEKNIFDCKQRMTKDYGNCRVIERQELPYFTPFFHNAVNLKEGYEKEQNIENCLVYDIEKAKELLREEMRKVRNPLLQELDIQFMIYFERQDTVKLKEIFSKKQQLRDITEIVLPDNFNELQDFWPEILGPNPYKII
jgi:hypothetical protein